MFVTLVSLFYLVGDETFDYFRLPSYENSDAILICFSMDSPNSLENVPHRWLPEIKKYLPNGMTTSLVHLIVVLLLLFYANGFIYMLVYTNLISSFSSNT